MKQESCIKISNKFDSLEEEECVLKQVIKLKSNDKKGKEKIKTLKQKKKENDNISNYKVNEKGWLKYETKNTFELLKDNDEEVMNKIIFKHKILTTPKPSLKKCKRCNFKKRSCILNPLSCKAIKHCCTKCQKIGHHPKSQNCKARPKLKKSKRIEQRNFGKDALFLINRRISQLESEAKSNTVQDKCDINNSNHRIPVKLIPFLFMYIFLNVDSFCSRYDEKCQLKMEKNIIKSARYCAKKIENNNSETSEKYFIKYCSKQIF